MLGPLYWLISKILLLWHGLFSAIGMAGEFLGTNWDWVLAIVFMVITIRAILFPIFVKQIKSQRAMQALAPQLTALKEKHKGDREGLQRATMELYKKENANPLMGCLPMVVQIPVMWSLFHVLRHLKITTTNPETKTLYGWSVDQFDSAVKAKFLGAPITAAFKSSAADVAAQHSTQMNVRIVAAISGGHHDRHHLPDQPSDDPQDRLVGGPVAEDDPAADALRHPGHAALLRLQLPHRCGAVLDHHQPVLARPAVLGAAQVPAAGQAGQHRAADRWRSAYAGRRQGGHQWALGRGYQGEHQGRLPAGRCAKGGPGKAQDKQAPKSTTRFGRKPATPPPAPAREVNKALAPKPGAKPVNPKRGGGPKVTPGTAPEGVSEAEAAASDTPAPNTGQNGSRAKSAAKRNSG